jgi:hypothetical protein
MWKRAAFASSIAVMAASPFFCTSTRSAVDQPVVPSVKKLKGEGAFYYRRFFHVYDARLFVDENEEQNYELELKYHYQIKGTYHN